MNPLIETLNRCGENAFHFAWPMLWQSSVLIAVLFASDFVLRRRVRAAVRYALWLVVLMKLLLPPSLALPTSLAWWLFPTAGTPAKPPTTHFTVSYGDAAPALPPQPAAVFTPPPRPLVSTPAWVLLAWCATSLSLLAWLMVRWRRVMRDVKHAIPAPTGLNKLFDEARGSAGLRRPVCLRLTEQTMSPAVCGLFRPVILLPQSLVEKLPPAQLRAVLLHELVHLRRGDVWTNCAQALAQIVYWWHPLLWPANARIRRAREEAVDDAVMLTLREDAGIYAPTLLEVAKLAFHRPLASLGLVGILESRSALRQRIERLVNFHAPRKAGLTFVSIFAILVFSAIAVPMGQAPVSTSDQFPANAAPVEQTLTVKVDPEVFIRNVKAQTNWMIEAANNDYTTILLDILRGEGIDCVPPHGLAFNTKTGEITTQNTPEQLEIFRRVIERLNRPDGKCELPMGFTPFHRKSVLIESRFYWMRSADLEKLVADLSPDRGQKDSTLDWWIAPEQFNEINQRIKSLGLRPFTTPRVQTSHGITSEMYCGTETNGVKFDCEPFVIEGGIELAFRTEIVGDPTGKDQTLVGTNRYQIHGRTGVEDHGGLVIRAENPNGSPTNLVMVVGIQIVTNNPPPAKTGELSVPSRQIEAGNLVADAKSLYEMGKFDEAEAKLKTAVAMNPDEQTAHYYLGLIENARRARNSPPGSSLAGNGDLIHASQGRKNIMFKLDRIRLDTVRFEKAFLSEVLNILSEESKRLDPEKQGINFLINSNSETAANPAMAKISLNLVGVRLVDVLDGVVLAADKPIKYSITDYGIVFSLKTGQETAKLETRTFKVDPDIFFANLQKQTGLQTNVSAAFKQLMSNAGVDFSPPKSIFFNNRLGILYVHATGQDLDAVEKAVMVLNYTPPQTPQIHIKARFIKAPEEILTALDKLTIITHRENLAIRPGIMTAEPMRALLRRLESVPDVEILAEPEVTTTSGRQTQMRATDILNIVTNFVFQETSSNSAILPQQDNVEVGPSLDTVASVLSDGYTIDLTAIPSLKEFLGYDQPTNSISITNTAGKEVSMPTIIPKFSVRQAEAHIKLWDGQTVVLGGLISSQVQITKDPVPVSSGSPAEEPQFREQTTSTVKKRQLLVLITVTLVDAAGNRIHSDDEMPFARNSIPPQDSR